MDHSNRTAWYALCVLSLAYILSYLDRIIINLLVQPIKSDLSLSDTQFGMLQGLAFGLFYTLMALPLGRMADLYSRRNIIAVGTAVFSLFSFFSGLAQNFWQLFVARVGVGAGEASLTPASHSIISDSFPPEKLGRAMSIFTMSAFLGIGLAYLFGGSIVSLLNEINAIHLPIIGEVKSWQMAFFCVALPGAVVIPLLYTFPEPRRRVLDTQGIEPVGTDISVAVSYVWERRKVLWPLFAGFATITLSSYASAVWTPAFFIRTYSWSAADIGFWYGLTYIAMGPAGAYFGGWMCDRLTAAGKTDAPLRVAAYGYVGAGVFGGLAPLMPTGALAMLLFAPAVFLSTLPFPLAGTALQLIAPSALKAQLAALYMLVINVVGLGLGPLAVGLMTDYIFQAEDQIRYSLAFVNAFCAPAAFLFLMLAFEPYRQLRNKGRKQWRIGRDETPSR